MEGKNLADAGRSIGTTGTMVKRWLTTDEAFQAEYQRQGELLRKSLVNRIVTLGNKSAEALTKFVDGKNASRRLVASKAGLTAGVAMVKSIVEAGDGVRTVPMFVLPSNTRVSFDVDIPSVPDQPASEVVDAELSQALSLNPAPVVDEK